MNNKKRIVNLEYFREMLQICPRIPNQPFNELPFEEEILAFLKELSHNGETKMITDGMYHKKNKDFAYLSWEDSVYQVEHKDSKKSNEMYYPWFTKVIVNFFMTKDQSIPRRNKEYYVNASGAEPPKTKASFRKKQSSSDTTVPPPTAKGKRLNTLAKVDKPAKEKQPAKSSKAKCLTMLSEVALTEAEQMKLATKRSLTQTHISHASGSGVDEITGIILGVLDVPTYESDDEEISWKSSEDDDDDDEVKISKYDDDVDDQSDDDDQDDNDGQDDQDDDDDQDEDDDEQTNPDDDGNDFIHPKFSTHDEDDKDEESFDHIGNKGANEEDKGNELYRDVNINLEGRDIQMADVQTTQVIEDTHVTLTPVNPEGQQQSSSVSSRFVSNMLNPSPDTGIDSIFESTPRVDVLVTTTAEPPLLSLTTLPPPSILFISHVQQTPDPSPTNVLSSSLQDLPNFSSLFKESARDVYSKRRIIAVTKLQIIEWHNYKHLDWITIRRDDDKLYKFKERDFKMLRIQDIKDMMLLQHVEDLQLGVESYQKKLNLTKPDTYRSYLKCKEAYTAYSNPKGFIYQNKDKQNRLMRIDELQKFSNVTLNDVQTALDDRLKGIRMQYLPQTIWRRSDKDRAAKMIQAINKKLKTRRIMRSLEKFDSRGRCVIPFDNFINNDLEYLRGGDFKRVRIQDIEDMLLLLVQGKLTNLIVEERFAFNVSLRMFTRSIVIERRVEDLQLGVESYQKKLNLTKLDTYHSDLKRKEAYIADKDRAAAMIQAIDKRLKTIRIMRSLKRFVRGRRYEGDFMMLQRTI
nr:hypothetical protein [Tanacetum cinerariifolium]